ncbi:hypothetical protein ACFQ60_07840 [Streptomyces zhihengii]
MTAAEPLPTAQVRIDHESAVHLAATVARDTALRCGLEGRVRTVRRPWRANWRATSTSTPGTAPSTSSR